MTVSQNSRVLPLGLGFGFEKLKAGCRLPAPMTPVIRLQGLAHQRPSEYPRLAARSGYWAG